MATEIKVVSFKRQGILAGVIFLVCAVSIFAVKYLQRHTTESDFSVSDIHLKAGDEMQRETIVERDVEVNLLEPLLIKLGFGRQDWVRQLPVQIGRSEKAFPDYALLVDNKGEYPIAKYVWEAKYSIPTEHQLRKDFRQVRSYALLLQAKALCLVSKEGVWFVESDSGFEFKSFKHFTWEELQDRSCLEQLNACFQNDTGS